MTTTQSGPELDSAHLLARIERFHTVRDGILAQVRQVIVGQQEVLDQILTALFVGGHCLITGLPGTAKTLMVRTIARSLGLEFRRIQFTPDLMPADITGTDIIEEDASSGHRRWTFVRGPIFGNIVLADEINRTPPKTQSALLEAMQELSCTVRGNQYELPRPVFVLATQNPIELEVLERTTSTHAAEPQVITGAQELLSFQELVRMVPIGESIARYVVRLVRATRFKNEEAPEIIRKYVNYGASVRAAQFITLAAKARALAHRRYHVAYEDITASAIPVLRHRILLNFHAESDRVDADQILRELIRQIAPPDGA